MKKSLTLLLVTLCIPLFAQVKKSADLAIISFVKKGKIFLRWAPANSTLWRAGNTYGYKIERILFDQYMEGGPDSVKFKNAKLINSAPLTPWKQNDDRWKPLQQKNKIAGFLFKSLYSPDLKATPQKKEMTYGLLMKSCDLYKDLALAQGLFISDSAFNENEIYVYRVSIANPPKSLRYTPAFVAVDPKEITALQKPGTLKAKFGDRRVVLSFPTKDVKDHAGYWIERSEDSINFKAVNRSPFIRSTTKYDDNKVESLYSDSLPVNNKRYYYRVSGISFFGEPGPASNVVSGIGRPALKEYPFIDSVLIIKNSAVLLKFHMAENFDKNLLQGFTVYRSEKKNGPFTLISTFLSPKSVTYTDDRPLESNYYRICATNIYGDSSISMTAYAKLIDETPPAIPAEATGTIDSNGVVKINWDGNTEKDLMGYRVYRSNSLKEQPVELTKKILTETTFTDKISLNTLTREVYYSIRAVDKVYNNSAYSNPCKLLRPDKIKPVAVVFSKIEPTDSSIVLKWHNSSSNDVKKYSIYKKENRSGWQLIKELPVEENAKQYIDTAVTSGAIYQYKIEVCDESGNKSLTETQQILFKPAFFQKIKTLKAAVDLEKRSIELQWQYNNDNVFSYVLYKAKANEPFRSFKTLGSQSVNFIDKELYPSNQYRYAIKAILRSGAETKLSDVIVVEF